MSVKRNIKLVSIHVRRSSQAMGLAALMLKAQLLAEEGISGKISVDCLDFYLDDGEIADQDIGGQETGDTEKYKENNKDEKIYEIISDGLNDPGLPAMVGFSTYVWNRPLVVELARRLKKQFPGSIVFAGGAEASANPVSLLNDGGFDFVVKGEAEKTIVRVMRDLLDNQGQGLDQIPGVYTQTNRLQEVCQAPPVEDLDALPSPYLGGLVDLKKQKAVLWELSRGCRFHCTFCYEGLGVKTVRKFSLKRIRAELELFETEQINQVFVLDPVFNLNPGRTKEVLELILEIAPLIHFTFEVRAEFLRRDVVELFARLRCNLQIGLESANPDALAAVRRTFDAEKFAARVGLLNEYDVIFGLDLIYGLPQDTLSGFKTGLDYAVGLQPHHLDIFPLSVLPGTELAAQREVFGLEVMPVAPYTLVSSPSFTEHDMKKAALLATVVEVFYNRGAAVYWFFMVVETLQVSASEIFEGFARWVYLEKISMTNPAGDQDLAIMTYLQNFLVNEILENQVGYLEDLFCRSGRGELFGVLSDLVQYHFALAQALRDASAFAATLGPVTRQSKEAGPGNESLSGGASGAVEKGPKNMPLRLSSAVRILRLRHNLDDLSHVGQYTFEEFLREFQADDTTVLVYPWEGEVISEPVEPEWGNLLERFRVENTLENILKNNSSTGFSRKNTNDFITYCLDRRILLLA